LTQVSEVFSNYIQGKIKKFPFSEGQLALETSDLTDILVLMNQNKLLTLNSQPKVNGAKSSDEKYGWGPANGYVYQKAYFELFVDQSIIKLLCDYLETFPSISYQAVNKAG
jgi:methylenetetrahydrofolate reductase (NADPH)